MLTCMYTRVAHLAYCRCKMVTAINAAGKRNGVQTRYESGRVARPASQCRNGDSTRQYADGWSMEIPFQVSLTGVRGGCAVQESGHNGPAACVSLPTVSLPL